MKLLLILFFLINLMVSSKIFALNEDSVHALEYCKTTAGKTTIEKLQSETAYSEQAQLALSENNEAINKQIAFDCSESILIDTTNKPYVDSVGSRTILEHIYLTPFSFVKNTVKILAPYCRKNNWWFGTFCMAADIDSASQIEGDPDLLKALPEAILLISKKAAKGSKYNIFSTLEQSSILIDIENRNKKLGLLSSFLGLDDNGVQTSRLLAILLKNNRYDVYSFLFPVFFQMGSLPPLLSPGSKSPVSYQNRIGSVFFSTRNGKARFPGLQESQTKTYKAWAGVYFGCRMASLGESSMLTLNQAYIAGALYEIIKLKSSFNKPFPEKLEDLKRYTNKAVKTGQMMKIGARYGYSICS
jgi:hypothetical protein